MGRFSTLNENTMAARICNREDNHYYKHQMIKAILNMYSEEIYKANGIDKDKPAFQHKKSLYNIHDYLIECQKELRENIKLIEYAKQSNTKINIYEFNNIINRIFYYIGTASIYLKYCDSNAYEELDIKDVWDYYGYNMNLLLKVFVENVLGFHTKELIEAMAKIRLLIVQH